MVQSGLISREVLVALGFAVAALCACDDSETSSPPCPDGRLPDAPVATGVDEVDTCVAAALAARAWIEDTTATCAAIVTAFDAEADLDATGDPAADMRRACELAAPLIEAVLGIDGLASCGYSSCDDASLVCAVNVATAEAAKLIDVLETEGWPLCRLECDPMPAGVGCADAAAKCAHEGRSDACNCFVPAFSMIAEFSVAFSALMDMQAFAHIGCETSR